MKQLAIIAFLLLSSICFSQQEETNIEKTQRMAWWKEAKFGLFIHWGLYAVAAGEYNGQKGYGEWLMYEANIPKAEYEKFAPQFNPTQFNAEAWVLMAKNAGMKYIVITSKHHDGFSLFDSKVSDYDIMDRTPFKRDPLRELGDACRKHGLKLCFYHSIMDWHHPHENKTDFARYRDEYLLPQLKELLTNYGDIGVLWFDGEWIEEWTEEQGKALYHYVRNLQPGIIVNNRVGKGRNGMQGMSNSESAAGDFGTPEQEILGEKNTLDWESCMTMNDHWGYNKNDKNFKSAEDLIWNLADITAKDGNYLLNVGPTAEGLFPAESVDRLNDIGSWMAINHEAVYASKPWSHWREGDYVRYAEGQNGDVYVFLKAHKATKLILKKISPQMGSTISMLGCAEKIPWRVNTDGLVLQLPPMAKQPFSNKPDWPRVLRIKGKPETVSAPPMLGTEPGQARKSAVFSNTADVFMAAEPQATIFYTTDGSEPNPHSIKYTVKRRISKSMTIKAIAQVPGKRSSETVSLRCEKARYGIKLESVYAEKYAAQGPLSLVDGSRGSTNFSDGRWLGFEGTDCSATLDLGTKKSVRAVNISCLRVIPSWIFLPPKIELWASNDKMQFTHLHTATIPAAQAADANAAQTFSLPVSGAYRYFKVVAQNQGVCPSWHPGAGAKAWVFVDEIWVQ